MPYTALDCDAACAALRDGKLIVYPTETFYGLGCDALNPDAVGAIYTVKRRPYGMPLPVVIGDPAQLERVTSTIHPVAARLMEEYWPGPLSIIFTAAPEVPDLLTGNTARIAVRYSPHPAVMALCRQSGLVLTASSANLSGQPPANRPEELDDTILSAVAGVFDAAPYPLGGEPSTIVDILPNGDKGVVRVLREGAIEAESLRLAGFSVIFTER